MDWLSGLAVAGMWVSAMCLDLYVTFENRSRIPKHEQSVILSAVYRRFSIRISWLMVAAIETACVASLPVIIMHGFDPAASTAVAYLFATLHCTAILSNERFLEPNGTRHTQEPGDATP